MMGVFTYEALRVKSSDVSELGCQVTGTARRGEIVFVNGLAGRFSYWRHQVESIAANYRCFCWDHRGFYDSSIPPTPLQLNIPYHVRDMKQIVDKLGVHRVNICAWSIGVQIALEFYRLYPDYCSSLILVNGCFDWDHQRLLSVPISRTNMTRLSELLQIAAPALGAVLNNVGHLPYCFAILRQLGIFSPTIDDESLRYFLHDLETLNFTLFAVMLDHAVKFSVDQVFATIKIPTLVIGSDKDHLTSGEEYNRIHTMIPASEFLMIPSGSHYTPLEFPALINRRIEKFLHDHDL